MKNLEHKLKQAQQYLQHEVRTTIGNTSLEHYKEGFQNQGFTDKKLNKWKEVKRREDPKTKGAKKTRKILSGDTKQLSDGLEYRETSQGVDIVSDVVYMQIHNEGGKAGRGGSAEIPQRKIVGESQKLNEKLADEISDDLNRIFN